MILNIPQITFIITISYPKVPTMHRLEEIMSELVYKLLFERRHALVEVLHFHSMSTKPSGFTVLTGQVR